MATTTYGTPYVSGTDLVANWPAASLTVANSIDAAGYYIGRGISTQTGSMTTVLTDAGKTITMSNASANTVTIPANSSVAYVIGTQINILNLGAGACTPTAGAGVTIAGTITALATNEFAALIKTATNTWSYLVAATPAAPGLSLVTPTSVAGTGVTLSGGAVSFSGSSTVSVNGCFTSTYRNYRAILTYNSSLDQGVNMRMRVSGTDTTSSNYVKQRLYASSTTIGASRVTDTSWEFTNVQTVADKNSSSIEFFAPNLSTYTSFNNLSLYGDAGAAIFVVAGTLDLTTAYDGFTIFPTAGTLTGSLRVYGYRNS